MGYVQTIALSEKYEAEGTIALHFADRADMTRSGYFSMTLYYRSEEPFTDTDYFHGINIYAKFINSAPFFANVGLIIYTDKETYPILQSYFGTYPKVIIAVVNWPRFAQSGGRRIEGTILRTLRYQAQDHFKGAWIAIRDADTIFAYEINNCLKVIVGDLLTEISEENNAAELLKQYMPLNKKSLTNVISRPNADKLMTNLGKMIASWEEKFISRWLSAGDLIVISTSDDYHASWHRHLPFTYAPKPLPKTYNTNTVKTKFTDAHERSHFDKLLAYRQDPSFVLLRAPLGVYAGFTNIAAGAPKDIWTRCCKYLTSFYSMIKTESGKSIISNTYSSIQSTGKDERVILFALITKYLDDMYFIHLDYYGGLQLGEDIVNKDWQRAPAIQYADIYVSRETAIAPVQTLLLAPNYVESVYTLPYVEQRERSSGPDELVVNGTMNEHFHSLFSKMVVEYKQFMKDIDKFGTSALKNFGARVERDSAVLLPSLAETVYAPIQTIRPRRVFTVAAEELPNNRAAARSKAKNTRRRDRSRNKTRRRSHNNNNN